MLLCRTVHTGFGLDFERLLADTPSALFEQWRVLYDLEPWDAERLDEAIGTLIAHVAAVHGVQPKAPVEYMRLLRGEPAVQSQDEMKRVFEAVCRIVKANPPTAPPPEEA